MTNLRWRLINGRYSVQWYQGLERQTGQRSPPGVGLFLAQVGYAATVWKDAVPCCPRNTAVYPCAIGERTLFAPFAMMKLADPSRLDIVRHHLRMTRNLATRPSLDVQYVQTLQPIRMQRFVEADIILSDGFSPEVTIRSEGTVMMRHVTMRLGECWYAYEECGAWQRNATSWRAANAAWNIIRA